MKQLYLKLETETSLSLLLPQEAIREVKAKEIDYDGENIGD